jgi:hypothetical protein
MFKWMVFIKRKKGMSREAFIDYYENHHAELCRRLLPRSHIYRRNYLVHNDPMFAPDGRGGAEAEMDFDVVTESVFGTREEAEALMNAFANPEIMKQIQADEANFVEPGHAKMYLVEVYQSPIP